MEPTPLGRIRRAKGYTQKSLAERLGNYKETISLWERKAHPPKLEIQVRLAEAFGMSLFELQRECNWPITQIPGLQAASNG